MFSFQFFDQIRRELVANSIIDLYFTINGSTKFKKKLQKLTLTFTPTQGDSQTSP